MPLFSFEYLAPLEDTIRSTGFVKRSLNDITIVRLVWFLATMATEQLANALFNFSSMFALPFEQAFHPDPAVAFVRANTVPVLLICAAYLTFCYVGQKIMAERKAFDLRLPLAAWNLFLSLFSFIGMLRTVPYLLAKILTVSYEETVCTPATESYGTGPVGFWVCLFIFSKVPELIDTVFIVLRKKPLIFLHWYHHVTVLLYCYHAYATFAGSGLYFVAMNYSVHAMMYGYFCLQALHLCPKSFPAWIITVAQIAQMLVGTGVCVSSWYFLIAGRPCANDFYNLIAGAVMYGSYLYLFAEFAVKRFIFKPKSKGSKQI